MRTVPERPTGAENPDTPGPDPLPLRSDPGVTHRGVIWGPGPGSRPCPWVSRRLPAQYQLIGFTMPPLSHTIRCRWQPVE